MTLSSDDNTLAFLGLYIAFNISGHMTKILGHLGLNECLRCAAILKYNVAITRHDA